MLRRTQLAELPPRPGASPGLLRRRYSVPETIMRKYRLAQQRSVSEDGGASSSQSPASATPPRVSCGSCGACGLLCEAPHRFVRRDRELMRKSALLRRLWGRPCSPAGRTCSCACCSAEPGVCCARETRSLDGSRSELRQHSPASSRHAPTPTGWATPKRQRLDSPHDHDMLRAAMRNSFDKHEETRNDGISRADFSDSTYRSHGRSGSSVNASSDTLSDSRISKSYDRRDRDVFAKYERLSSSEMATAPLGSYLHDETPADSYSSALVQADDRSYTDTSDTFSTSMCTAKETDGSAEPKICARVSKSEQVIDGRVSVRSASVDNDEDNLLVQESDTTAGVNTPTYELLEIVVSETVNTNAMSAIDNISVEKLSAPIPKLPLNRKIMQNIDIDEYVSNILVESLNSLTDQLECMNASIASDRKISIVEKEIKVKLQNTGVNTIVHLSPTSNNQIIFGNEELYDQDERKDECNRPSDVVDSVRDETRSVESNNNLTSADTTLVHELGAQDAIDSQPVETFNMIPHDNVNRAVLQQIQKLFQEELHHLDPEMNYSANGMTSISHIEISNVDVYIDDNSDSRLGATDTIEMQTQRNGESCDAIGGVGAGNYFRAANDNSLVPRFSAFPHTDSMEVNTSSSDDTEVIGSDCTSLVDSLDDPNSPRSVLLRRALRCDRRGDLVRSAVNVLDLLPDSALADSDSHPREKGESFFIRIKDDDCDCEKENVVVADHMPEKIKQRLYRRHRKRELRMECARRGRVKQLRRELDKQRHRDACRSNKDVEKDCVAIVSALIDDVIAKIAHDEYKCMRIKQKSSGSAAAKSDENIYGRSRKKDVVRITNDKENAAVHLRSEDSNDKERRKSERNRIRGRLSLQTHPPPAPRDRDRGPKRVYQKSEIHEGNKCIEILEILEYVDSSQSSPETTNSDENHNHNSKNKKSRIPVPVHERIQSMPKPISQGIRKSGRTSPPSVVRDRNDRSGRLLASMLLDALADNNNGDQSRRPSVSDTTTRRASLPVDTRSRADSYRFRRVFDIIPEERSSLSVDSSNEDLNYNRRVSAPNLNASVEEHARPSDNAGLDSSKANLLNEARSTRSAATSPLADTGDKNTQRNQTTMTSPSLRLSASGPRVWPSATPAARDSRHRQEGIALACAPCR